MIFDYISLHYFIALLVALPLLNCSKFLNPLIYYMFITACINGLSPFANMANPLNLKVSIALQSLFFISYLLAFVLLIRSNINSHNIYGWLAKLGKFSILCSLLAIAFVQGCHLFYDVLHLGKYLPPVPNNLHFASGLVPNKAMNAVLNLMLIPFVFAESPIWAGLGILTVILSKSSTAMLTLAVAIALWICANNKKLPAILMLGASFIFGTLLTNGLFDDGGRFKIYKFYLSGLTRQDWLFGRGAGSFLAWGPYLQSKSEFAKQGADHGWWIFAHSDVIQFICDSGLLGCLLIIPVLYMIAKYAKHAELLGLAAFFTGGLLYYPAHFGAHLLVAALLVKLVVNNYERV